MNWGLQFSKLTSYRGIQAMMEEESQEETSGFSQLKVWTGK